MVSNSVNKLGITELYNIQDKHIKSHSKLNVSERIHYLVKLKKTIQSRENEIEGFGRMSIPVGKFRALSEEGLLVSPFFFVVAFLGILFFHVRLAFGIVARPG